MKKLAYSFTIIALAAFITASTSMGAPPAVKAPRKKGISPYPIPFENWPRGWLRTFFQKYRPPYYVSLNGPGYEVRFFPKGDFSYAKCKFKNWEGFDRTDLIAKDRYGQESIALISAWSERSLEIGKEQVLNFLRGEGICR